MNAVNFLLKSALGLVLTLPAWAGAISVNGVKLDEAISLRGTPLILNGAGVRYQAQAKLYVAALYLGKKVSAGEDVFAVPGPKRISLTMLRTIDANELGKLFVRGVQSNMPPSDMPHLIPGLAKMGQVFAQQSKLGAGDVVLLEWVPGVGTLLTVKGKQVADFKEPQFFAALLGIWLGNKPVDGQLKNALLGKS